MLLYQFEVDCQPENHKEFQVGDDKKGCFRVSHAYHYTIYIVICQPLSPH
jgi:hypothetical protein